MKIVDLQLNIDGLILDENQSVEEFVSNMNVNSVYPVIWEILSEEYYE